MLSALSFGTGRDLAGQLHQMCAWTQDIHIYRGLEHYPQGHETLRLLNAFAPQIVFLALDNEVAAAAVARDIQAFLPAAAILGVFAAAAKRRAFETDRGMLPVLGLPCSPESFRAATVDALDALSIHKNGEVFAFLPAKAGSGATTAALFVADLVAKRARQRVLLLECDLHAGPVAMLNNWQPQYSILDALEDSSSLTDSKWKNLLSHLDGIDILPSAGRVGSRHATAWGYQSLLAFVRSRYDVVIADLPEVVEDATEVVVRAAKTVFVVTAPSTPSLQLATRRRYDLEARGVASAKVKFILNRLRANQSMPREAGWAINLEKIAAIPMDETLIDASGFRPALADPSTVAAFARVAEYSTGLKLTPAPETSRKSWLEGWMRPSRSLAHSTSAAR
jgi:MinD-like ATPase involved in chromosome partitioning or flagellar assembly